MKKLEDDQEAVKNEVNREELNETRNIIECRVKNPKGEDSTPVDKETLAEEKVSDKIPGDDPNNGEQYKDSITSFPKSSVPKHLGELQQVVRTVVDNQHQGSYPGEVCCPGEHHEKDGSVMVDEHLPEVFPLDIKELAD